MVHRHEHDGPNGHGGRERSMGLAALLTGLFMLAEAAGGLISGSLALLADAGHMLTDFASLSLAWYGFHLARRPADWKRTYGYDRFSVLVAFTNGLALFVIAAWILAEAWQRLGEPVEIEAGVMLSIAAVGLAVNIIVFRILHGGDHSHDLNVRAAALHVMGDLLGSVAAIIAAVVIMLTGWFPIDPILSALVAVIILRSAWRVVSESGHILLEGTPAGIDNREIARDLMDEFPSVADVHHVHAWSISEARPMATMHVRLNSGTASGQDQVISAIKKRLSERFGLAHTTIEVEYDRCGDHVTHAGHAHARGDQCG
ncbi:MAG: cation diffusion facilitator family transporter [Hyphomicrobiaceae bacterium]